MNHYNIQTYFIFFVLALVFSAALTPLVKMLAIKIKAIDIPDERKIHNKPIPRMGGLAIYLSFTICSLIFLKNNASINGILLGGLIIVIEGIVDDIKNIKPLYKLSFQLIAAIILVSHGFSIGKISLLLPQLGFINLGILEIPITIIWIIGIINAVNLIDGLDGLACGVSLISSIFLFVIALLTGRFISASIMIILAGATIGFLPYNYNPASIFLGDTGSQFLGFILSAVAILGTMKSATTIIIIVPLILLGVPIYDTLSSIIRRTLNGKPIMSADKGHIHHKLLAAGFNQRQAVNIIYGINICLGISALSISYFSDIRISLLIIAQLVIICYCQWRFVLLKGVKKIEGNSIKK